MELNLKFDEQLLIKACNKVLDEYEYNGKTIREWADRISNPKTNGDNFRAMTDEEMAQYICKLQYRDGDFCPPTHNCEVDKSCEKCWLEWLRQECE